MSKGGKPQTTTTSSSTQIPDWLTGAAQQAIGQATDLSQRPYTPYGGEQVAPTSADQSQSYQQVRDLQGSTAPAFQQSAAAYSPLLSQLHPLTTGDITSPTNQLYGNYQQQVMNPAQGLLGGYLQGGPATAGQVGSNAQQLMSPYTQNVIDPALQAGAQQLALAKQGISGNAANVGAFGGSRQGVQEGVADAQTALGTQQFLGNMLNTGWNQALTPAYNLASLASQQGYGAAGQLAGMGQAGYNAAATQGANLAGTNLGLGQTAAQQLPQLATAGLADAQKETSMLQTVGSAQQQQQQAVDNAAMGQFYGQQDWPVQNLDILLGAVSGVPYGTSAQGTSVGTTPQKNVAAGVVGGAASGAATGAALGPWGAAAGGVVGGILGALTVLLSFFHAILGAL